MKPLILTALILSFSFAAHAVSSKDLARKGAACANADSNPETGDCYTALTEKADASIRSLIAKIKKEQLSETEDAHGRDLTKMRFVLDDQFKAFVNFRDKVMTVTGVLDGGTGSDQYAVSTEAAFELTLGELARLEKVANGN